MHAQTYQSFRICAKNRKFPAKFKIFGPAQIDTEILVSFHEKFPDHENCELISNGKEILIKEKLNPKNEEIYISIFTRGKEWRGYIGCAFSGRQGSCKDHTKAKLFNDIWLTYDIANKESFILNYTSKFWKNLRYNPDFKKLNPFDYIFDEDKLVQLIDDTEKPPALHNISGAGSEEESLSPSGWNRVKTQEIKTKGSTYIKKSFTPVIGMSKSGRSLSPEFSLGEPLPMIPKGDSNAKSNFYKLEPQPMVIATACFKNHIPPEKFFLQYPVVKRGSVGRNTSEFVTPAFRKLTPVEEILDDEVLPESIFKTNPSIIPSLRHQSLKSMSVQKSAGFKSRIVKPI